MCVCGGGGGGGKGDVSGRNPRVPFKTPQFCSLGDFAGGK